ncbi:hypothetical protein CMUS01_04680 [Colletotrichum musicola]|uniref:Uncharacterized protein n=1 Tax=Colletotrichum musicola TaxID=2175873 RepID=A0A8H6KV88_9PEZI|nr:hypothetical protein CMUS01_04680 [Colletotrichum musicola]
MWEWDDAEGQRRMRGMGKWGIESWKNQREGGDSGAAVAAEPTAHTAVSTLAQDDWALSLARCAACTLNSHKTERGFAPTAAGASA